MKLISPRMGKGAGLSSNKRYRYWLSRAWDADLPTLTWIMLNPSTADAYRDDATIRVVMGRSRLLGYGGILVVNLFAYRAKNPEDMKAYLYPVGKENDEYILEAVRRSGNVMCAWGNHSTHMDRENEVVHLITRSRRAPPGTSLWHLGMTVEGHPKHPLRIAYSVMPELWGTNRAITDSKNISIIPFANRRSSPWNSVFAEAGQASPI